MKKQRNKNIFSSNLLPACRQARSPCQSIPFIFSLFTLSLLYVTSVVYNFLCNQEKKPAKGPKIISPILRFSNAPFLHLSHSPSALRPTLYASLPTPFCLWSAVCIFSYPFASSSPICLNSLLPVHRLY